MVQAYRLGALCWLLTAEFFVAQFAAQAAWTGYDLVNYDISLLGITQCGQFGSASSGHGAELCSPWHPLFNWGVIIHGALTLLGLALTWPLWPAGLLSRTGLLLLGLGGLGAIGVGIFPLGDDDGAHSFSAAFALGAPGFGLMLLGLALVNIRPVLAWASVITGLLILLGGLAHLGGGWPLGRGVVERLAAWPQTLWYMSVGLCILMAWMRPVSPARRGDVISRRTVA